MPLPKPVLDSRTFDQLVLEARGQLPRLAPAYTDYNYSDPAITAIDLFAWLAEQDFFRFDRVSAELRRAFLRLAQVTVRPAQIATTVVLFRTTGGTAVALPDRVQIAAGHGIVFETDRALTVSPARLVAIGADRKDVTAANAAAYEKTVDPVAGTFLPFGSTAPKPGAVLTLGFDVPLGAPAARVSLHVWTTTPEEDAVARLALIAEWEREKARMERDCPTLVAHLLAPWQRHYSVRTRWEYFAGAGGWLPLARVEDETRALTLTGFVRFDAPAGHTAGPSGLFAIRCRMTGGRYECAPAVDRIDINAVTAEHAETIDGPETLGRSSGHAHQRFTTARRPIVPGSTQLALGKGAQTDGSWTPVDEWDLSGPHDRHYRVEDADGLITTGNGLRAAVTPAEWELRLDYRVGGDLPGNIAAGSLTTIPATIRNQARIASWALVAPTLAIEQPIAAFGGAPREPLDRAQGRAIDALGEPRKAVTLDDFAVLARKTPGVPVGRAYALADFHPALSCVPAWGTVTVVIVPACRGPRPLPGPDMLRAVEAFLGRRRLVTAEVHAVAPHYVGVAVIATLHVAAGAIDQSAPGGIAAAARRALDAFFDPLAGGPDGRGWPAGRGVYRTEVLALLTTVDGVERVTGLSFQVEGEEGTRCGNVDVCATDLIASGRHRLSVPGSRVPQRSVEHECP
jgi:predicted phage baseplate assembly protein